MYDKVKIFCPTRGNPSDVSRYLDYCKEVINPNTGEVRLCGGVECLKVNIYSNSVSILGSLPKFLYGDNLCALNVEKTKEVVEKIGDALHLGFWDATVTEMEFGANLIMRKPVEAYLSKLGQMPRLERLQLNPDTVYYRSVGRGNGKSERIQQKRSLIFYDKVREVGENVLYRHGMGIYKNVLRYEMKMKGRLGQQLNIPDVPKVYVDCLYDRDFYRRLVDLWQSYYESICKTRKTTNDMSKPMTVKKAFYMFVAGLINDSEQRVVADFMNDLRANKVFADRKDYTRLRQKFARVSDLAGYSTVDEDMLELDGEIRKAAERTADGVPPPREDIEEEFWKTYKDSFQALQGVAR